MYNEPFASKYAVKPSPAATAATPFVMTGLAE
jgi:hypothetical protein